MHAASALHENSGGSMCLTFRLADIFRSRMYCDVFPSNVCKHQLSTSLFHSTYDGVFDEGVHNLAFTCNVDTALRMKCFSGASLILISHSSLPCNGRLIRPGVHLSVYLCTAHRRVHDTALGIGIVASADFRIVVFSALNKGTGSSEAGNNIITLGYIAVWYVMICFQLPSYAHA